MNFAGSFHNQVLRRAAAVNRSELGCDAATEPRLNFELTGDADIWRIGAILDMAGTRAKPELRTVTIAIVRDGAEVQAMQSKLKAAGIESFLTSERSYIVKKAHDLGRPTSPPGKEKGAVKVQVARADVQRALGVLGATSAAAPAPAQQAGKQLAARKSRQAIPRLLKDRDPTVPVIVVVFILVAALILSMS